MKLLTILVFAMASFFLVGRLDAGYKLEIKVEGGLKGSKGILIFTNISIVYHFNYHLNKVLKFDKYYQLIF